MKQLHVIHRKELQARYGRRSRRPATERSHIHMLAMRRGNRSDTGRSSFTMERKTRLTAGLGVVALRKTKRRVIRGKVGRNFRVGLTLIIEAEYLHPEEVAILT
jgi:hypothetical protein